MMRKRNWRNMLVYVVLASGIAGGLLWSFQPVPVSVEIHSVQRGSLQVTVEEDGKTRLKEKYVVVTPLAGRLARVQRHVGDAIRVGDTLATLDPTPPGLLDARSRAEADARLKSAEAARNRSDPVVAQARVAAQFAQEEFERALSLSEKKSITHEELDRAELRLRSANEMFRAAQFAAQIAEHELELARAALTRVQLDGETTPSGPEEWQIHVHSPITGRILRVLHEDAGPVAAGIQLLEVGNLADMEVVLDVLSSDAVQIQPGNPVLLEAWGGPEPLQARVKLVEPSGFTKVSALGVEEQRVNVIVDFVDPPEMRSSLGDDFRVEARVTVAHLDDVVKTPNGAVFRQRDEPAVFVVVAGRARVRPITLGRRNRLEAEVSGGLSAGEHVILYPGDKVHEGVRVSVRH